MLKYAERNRVFRELLLSGVSFTRAISQVGISKSSAYFHLDRMRDSGEWKKPKLKKGEPKTCFVCRRPSGRRKYCPEHGKERLQDPDQKIGDIRNAVSGQRNARIRQLARRAYRDSNLPKHCRKCGYSRSYDVCHVRAIQSFPDTATVREVNDLQNLVALCKRCHWEFDQGTISLSEFLEVEIMTRPA